MRPDEKLLSLFCSGSNFCVHRHNRVRRWRQRANKSHWDCHTSGANGFGADAHSGTRSRTGSGSGTHANARTNTNISDRTMGGRIA